MTSYTFTLSTIDPGRAYSVKVLDARGTVVASAPVFAHELTPAFPTITGLARAAAANLLCAVGVSAFAF